MNGPELVPVAHVDPVAVLEHHIDLGRSADQLVESRDRPGFELSLRIFQPLPFRPVDGDLAARCLLDGLRGTDMIGMCMGLNDQVDLFQPPSDALQILAHLNLGPGHARIDENDTFSADDERVDEPIQCR